MARGFCAFQRSIQNEMNITLRRNWCVALALLVLVPGAALAQGVRWEQRNGQWIGDVRAFAVAGDGTLLVGAEGVQQTTDLGATW